MCTASIQYISCFCHCYYHHLPSLSLLLLLLLQYHYHYKHAHHHETIENPNHLNSSTKTSSRNRPSFSMSAFNTVICIKPKRYAGWIFFRSSCKEGGFSVFLSPMQDSSISVVFDSVVSSLHMQKKELAPISSPKSWRFDLKSRPPKWLKWLKWQSKSISARKPQDSNELRSIWLSSSADFCFPVKQIQSQNAAVVFHKKKHHIAGTLEACSAGTGEFGLKIGVHWAVAGGKWGHFAGFP